MSSELNKKMASRLCFFGSRLLATPTRSYQLQSQRLVASSAALWNASSEVPKAPVVKSSGGREGLTGYLQEKTGVTGAWTLGVGVSAYLISKELYVINSETVIAAVLGGMIIFLMRKIGKPVAQFLDDKSQGILDLLNSEKTGRKSFVEDQITAESKVEPELDLRHDIFDIMKENNSMRMEEEYRRRLHLVNETVRRQLDYQVEVEKAQRKFQQEHMVQWLEKAVTELVKGKQDESLAQCMSDLKKMSTA